MVLPTPAELAMLTARQLVRGLPVVTRRFAQKLRRVMMVMPMPVGPVMRHVRGRRGRFMWGWRAVPRT